MNAFMNCPPAKVDITDLSRNSLRNWTSGASSEPYAADAITQGRVIATLVVVVVLVVRSEVTVEAVGMTEVWTDVTVTVGEKVVVAMNEVFITEVVTVG